MALLFRGVLTPFLTLIFFSLPLSADNFILKNDKLINDKAAIKINEIATEVKQKTGISIYFVVTEKIAPLSLKDYTKQVTSTFTSPYVLYILTKQEQKVDLVMSQGLEKVVDKNRVLEDFVIPILVSNNKEDKAHSYEAATLNGLVEMTDQIAEAKKVTISSNLSSDSYNVIAVLRIIFWSLVLLTIGIIIRNKYFIKE